MRAVASGVVAALLGACAAPRARPVADLPARVHPAQADGGRAIAIQLTSDSGGGRIDRQVTALLGRSGIPVTRLNSLRYFWSEKAPERLGADLAALIAAAAPPGTSARVLVIGYSMGADALPFAVNRLPDAVRARIALLLVLNPAVDAVFEFHVPQWWNHIVGPTRSTLPEFTALAAAGVAVVCIYGRQDPDAACPRLAAGEAESLALSGGHRFGSDPAQLEDALLASLAAHGLMAVPSP